MVRVCFYCLVCFSVLSCKNEASRPVSIGPVPTEAQMQWHEMEMNAFIHFSMNTFTDKEWGFGNESPTLFNPASANVEQWITTLRDAGFRAVILTTKHHDGFCLWPSKYTNHSIANSPYKMGQGDLVREVADACKKYGLKFGIYLSPWDRNRSDYGDSSYVEYYGNQLRELFTSYGPVFEMWFDGANGGDGYYGGANETRRINSAQYYDWPRTLDIVREFEPNVIFFSDAGPGVRWVGNERGMASETNWNTITPDTLYAGKANIETLLGTGHEDGTAWIPAEVDVSIRPGWFYHAKEDSLVKSAEKLFEIYLTSVGHGSTLLLNVPPDKRGLIQEEDVQVLREWTAIREREFKTNLALSAVISASTYRGLEDNYGAAKVNDQRGDTYWATDDGTTTGAIEIDFRASTKIKYLVLQEYIRLGQRVRKFSVERFDGNQWKEIADGTTIGYKRILKFDSLRVAKIRVNIVDAKSCPLISNVEVY
jgi:alpha-L-fucosidase